MNSYSPLLAPIEAALRDSIKLRGVIYPVVVDQHGRILDGHHRARIAGEEHIEYATKIVHVENDDEASEVARTLNEDRRHMPRDQRRPIVVALRKAGHSSRAIASALGVHDTTVWTDVRALKNAGADPSAPDARIIGIDGRSYPASKPRRVAPIVPDGQAVLQDAVLYQGPRRKEKPPEKYSGALPMIDRAHVLLSGAGMGTVVGRYRGPILRLAARVARIADAMRAERSAHAEQQETG